MKEYDEENINIDEDVKATLLFSCQYDIRRLLNILMDVKKQAKKNLDQDEWDNMYNNYSQKDLDISLYDAVEKSINNYNDIDTCLKYYEVDKNLVGMMIHENYPNHMVL